MQIIFTFHDIKINFRFNTHQSYEIKMLIEDYKNLNQFNIDFNVGLEK